MPLLTFQIAALTNAVTGATDAQRTYDFQDLQGTPLPATEQVQVINRPGVDYHGLRKLGKRGPPFRMRSIEYIEFDTNVATTLANASQQLADYKALIGDTLGVKATQRDLDYFPCDVLTVEYEAPPARVASVAGSLVNDAAVRLACVWTLVMRQA